MVINIDAYDNVFKTLKDFINENSDYKVYVTKLPIDNSDKFPQVVLTEQDNSLSSATTRMEETRSLLAFEVNIYAQDKVINSSKIARMQIARDLSKLVDNVLGYGYRMQRITCTPTPNLDMNIYRITMRYTGILNDNRIKFV